LFCFLFLDKNWTRYWLESAVDRTLTGQGVDWEVERTGVIFSAERAEAMGLRPGHARQL